jgi:ligand-binding SRPBCC domain-containing protein
LEVPDECNIFRAIKSYPMPVIHLTTFIQAPVERVFDLSRHIDLQKESMKPYSEETLASTRLGLVEENDTITWKARHLGKSRIMKLRVTDMQKPLRFTDEQATGELRMLKHEHHFKACSNGTIMIDVFQFESRHGVVGHWMNRLLLNSYIKKILMKRNQFIKEYAEGNQWQTLLQK